MIGIGVGIDYALFIVTRYRDGLHDGRSPRDAVVHSINTSGRAVLFAGTHRRHLPARPVRDRPQLHPRNGHRRRRGRAHRDAGLRHPPPGRPRVRRREHRQVGPAPRQASDQHQRQHVGSVVPDAPASALDRPPWPDWPSSSCWRSPRSLCAWASPTPATTPPARPPVAPTTCSPRASVPGAAGPCSSWPRYDGAAQRAAIDRLADDLAAAPGRAAGEPGHHQRRRHRGPDQRATDRVAAGRQHHQAGAPPARRRRAGRHRRNRRCRPTSIPRDVSPPT